MFFSLLCCHISSTKDYAEMFSVHRICYTRSERCGCGCVRQVRAPRVPVVSCAEARALREAAHVRRALVRLTCAPVRWEQTLHALYARPRAAPQPLTVVLGPAGALRATLRQVNARAWDASLPVEV